MIKRILLKTVLLIFLSMPLAVLADEHFSDIFIFGDSLSDNGNLAAQPGFEFLSSPFLPYDSGFSNGPRAVEVLADELGLAANPSLHLAPPFVPQGTNFAVAGARAVTLGFPPSIDLPTQIGAFLASQGGAAPGDALYVVFIGGNDIRDARDNPDKGQARAILRQAVAGVSGAVGALAAAGADHILVANSPDIGAIPETRAMGDKKFAKRATRLTRFFNRQLKKSLHKMEHDLDIDIERFDTFRFFRFVRKHATRLGFSNADDPCFLTSVFFTTGVPQFHPDCLGGLNFDAFVFFDEIHPTARVHNLAGREMAALFQEDDEDGEEQDD